MAGQLTIDQLKASTGVLATQNGMTGIAKAWVNFNGSTGAVNGGFNVSSVTVNGTGDYTVNFTTAMPNANYTLSGATQYDNVGAPNGNAFLSAYRSNTALTTTSCRIGVTASGSVYSPTAVYAQMIGA